MRVLPTGLPEPRPDRPATALLHDEANARIVAFHLLAGQEVSPHRSTSTVAVQVIEGEGLFQGEGDGVTLKVGETAVFAPDETHAVRAVGGALRFLAILTPRPS
jgi:quercetin dioxygenase-like cupin family protein